MTEEPENHTIRLIQEMRAEMRAEMRDMRVEMREGREKTEEAIRELSNRIDGNTLVFNMVAGLVHDHEQRISSLEGS